MTNLKNEIGADGFGQWWQLSPIDITEVVNDNPNIESSSIFFVYDTNHSIVNTGTYSSGMYNGGTTAPWLTSNWATPKHRNKLQP